MAQGTRRRGPPPFPTWIRTGKYARFVVLIDQESWLAQLVDRVDRGFCHQGGTGSTPDQ